MTAGSRHTRHFTGAPPEITGRISTTSSSSSSCVARHEGAAADHEHRLAIEVELAEARPSTRIGPGKVASRRGCGADVHETIVAQPAADS